MKNFILFLCILIASSPTSVAQQWVQTRGPGGGSVVNFIEKNGVILIGTYGGVFRSTDNGDTWHLSSDGIPNEDITSSFAATSTYIYAGNYATGLYRSANLGLTWNHVNVAVSSLFISYLFASHDTLYIGCDGCGIYRSVDEAASFQPINTGFPASAHINNILEFGPYLFTGLVGNGGTVGVYRTPVNSINWTQVNNGLGDAPSVIDMAIKGNDLLMTGVTFNSAGFFRTSDYGDNWRTQPAPALPNAEIPTILAVSGNDIYFGTDGDAPYRSPDDGVTWQRVNNGLKPLTVFSFLVGTRGIFVGYERGLARTTNNGATWERKTVGLTNTSVTSLYNDNNTTLYATARTTNIGSSDGVFSTTDGGQNWTSIDKGLLPNPQVNTLTKAGGNIIIGTDNFGLFIKTPADTAFRRASGIPDFLAVTSLLTSGANVIAGISGNGELYRSTDYGLTWVQSNNGFNTNQEDQVYSLYNHNGTIYAGAFNALYKSTDFGANWTPSSTGIYPGSNVYGITALGNDLFAVTSFSGNIYKSTNNGANWVQVNNGIPPIININTITATNGSLYAGSNLGVYKSDNAGNSWDTINNGLLPRKNSLSLAVFNNKLFLGTDETAVWSRDINVVLPVTLQSFTAKENSGIVNIDWKTVNEINSKYFDIQRSSDGQNFVSLGKINVSGNANGHAYSFNDLHPNSGFNYYRIITISSDGNKKYSGVILINLKRTNKLNIEITPNPSITQSTINISGNLKGKATIRAYDVSGKMVADLYSGEMNGTAFSTTLNFSSLKKGIYVLKLLINGEGVTRKLVIE